MNELLSKAEAMASAGPAFWQLLGLRSHSREQLEDAIFQTRDSEYRFCHTLTARLELLVGRQALDRTVWDYITRSREQLKIHLGRNFSPAWSALGFADAQLLVPNDYAGRIALMGKLHDHFKKHRPHQSAATGATAGHAGKILAQTAVLGANLATCQKELQAVVRQRKRAINRLERIERDLVCEVRRRLREKDPRWILSQPDLPGLFAPAAPVANMDQQNKTTSQLSLPLGNTHGELRESRHSQEPRRVRTGAFAGRSNPARSCAQSPARLPERRRHSEVPVNAPVTPVTEPSPAQSANDQVITMPDRLKLSSVLAWLFPPR